MSKPIFCIALAAVAFATTPSLGDDFPELTNSEKESEHDWLSPEEAAKSFKLPPGFSASVFASEPDVQNPIAMAWDGKGRLWVAENYTYAEREQRFDLSLRDRVVVFDNTSGNHFQTRTVFSDNLQMLTGIEVGFGGVWLMCPPKLLFIPDADQDAVPDQAAKIVLDGFEVAQQNYHNFANGLRFGPDGWLYGRCGGSCPGRIGAPGTDDKNRLALEGGIWRYHPRTQSVEVLNSGTTNPWGHDWNAQGEMFFVNTVNGHLWHFIPGSHLARPFTLDPLRRTYELIDFHADHWHFDTAGSWTDSRHGAADRFGGGHAHSGTMIYEEATWPEEYRDRLFTLNLHGLRANQEILRRKGSGYVAGHGPDFCIASDPWFRGMELSAGPDGNVFVFDWSDTGECHEHTGVHRTSGRIFKIHYDAEGAGDRQPKLGAWTDDALLAAVIGNSKWHRRQAKLELIRRGLDKDDQLTVRFRTQLQQSSESHAKLQLLLLLHSLGHADDELLLAMLNHLDEHVRAWSVRMLVDTMPADDAMGAYWKSTQIVLASRSRAKTVLPHLLRLAHNEPSALVRLALASSLGRLPIDQRPQLAAILCTHEADADDHNLPLTIWYGLIPCADNPESLVPVAKDCVLPTTLRLIARCIAEEIEKHPRAMTRLLDAISKRESHMQLAALTGLNEGFTGWPRAPQPANWNAFCAAASPECDSLVRELSVVFGDGRAITALIDVAKGKTASGPEIQLAALERLIQINPPELRAVCELLLGNGRMNVLAARGLSRFDDPEIAKKIIERYRNVRGPFRPQIISILSSRPSFAGALLLAIRDNQIPKRDLTAFHVRQILTFGDDELRARVSEVWGEVRESSAEKLKQITRWKTQLDDETLSHSNRSHGRALFVKNCQNCHRLYGQGGQVGPDLTGANRSNLDYLLSNVIDPSSVVDKDYRMTVLLLDDGRVINGLVTDRSEKTTKIQTATESIVVDNESIEQSRITEKSPMPEGMLDTLSDSDVIDLIGYLTHPSQVPLSE